MGGCEQEEEGQRPLCESLAVVLCVALVAGREEGEGVRV